MKREELVRLERFAKEIRYWTLKEITTLGFGHIAGSASIADLLALLYGKVMNIKPEEPDWPDRDYFVSSKGHAGPAIYAALALKGYFPTEQLLTLNQNGTSLPSHCDRNLTRGIDMTTGSLGQGVSTAIGIALGNKMDQKSNYTYLVVGDGELNEGQVWEGVLFAAHQKLDHLIAFVDENKKQLDGYTKDINDLGDITEKFRSFRWHAQYVDGHDLEAMDRAIAEAKATAGQPHVIVLDTVKGKGYPFIESLRANHHVKFNEEQRKQAQDLLRCYEQQLAEGSGS